MQIFGITENSSSVRKGWINGHGVKVETWFIVVLACVRFKKKKKKKCRVTAPFIAYANP